MKKAILDITLDNAMDILQEIEDKSNIKWRNKQKPTQFNPCKDSYKITTARFLILDSENGDLTYGWEKDIYVNRYHMLVNNVDEFLSYAAGHQIKEKKPQTIHKDYPHKCPNCGGPAYKGLLSTECKNNCK